MNWVYLPKVGDKGLAIPYRLYDGEWGFSFEVAKYMRRNNIIEAWYQCFDNNGWVWNHGIVILKSGRAIITQIG